MYHNRQGAPNVELIQSLIAAASAMQSNHSALPNYPSEFDVLYGNGFMPVSAVGGGGYMRVPGASQYLANHHLGANFPNQSMYNHPGNDLNQQQNQLQHTLNNSSLQSQNNTQAGNSKGRVSRFNPNWKDTCSDQGMQGNETQNNGSVSRNVATNHNVLPLLKTPTPSEIPTNDASAQRIGQGTPNQRSTAQGSASSPFSATGLPSRAGNQNRGMSQVYSPSRDAGFLPTNQGNIDSNKQSLLMTEAEIQIEEDRQMDIRRAEELIRTFRRLMREFYAYEGSADSASLLVPVLESPDSPFSKLLRTLMEPLPISVRKRKVLVSAMSAVIGFDGAEALLSCNTRYLSEKLEKEEIIYKKDCPVLFSNKMTDFEGKNSESLPPPAEMPRDNRQEGDIAKEIMDPDMNAVYPYKPNFKEYECFACELVTNNIEEYVDHMASKDHREIVERMARQQGSRLKELGDKHELMFPENKNKSMDFFGDSPSSRFCPACRVIFTETIKDHKKSIGHLARLKGLLCKCTQCDIMEFKTEKDYIDHCTSEKHIKAMAECNLPESIPGPAKLVPDYSPDVQIGSDYVLPVIRSYCALCRMYLPNGPDARDFHCRSLHHYQQYKMCLGFWQVERSLVEAVGVAKNAFDKNKNDFYSDERYRKSRSPPVARPPSAAPSKPTHSAAVSNSLIRQLKKTVNSAPAEVLSDDSVDMEIVDQPQKSEKGAKEEPKKVSGYARLSFALKGKEEPKPLPVPEWKQKRPVKTKQEEKQVADQYDNRSVKDKDYRSKDVDYRQRRSPPRKRRSGSRDDRRSRSPVPGRSRTNDAGVRNRSGNRDQRTAKQPTSYQSSYGQFY